MTKMSKKVIIIKGEGVFDTLQSASEATGRSISTISRAIRAGKNGIRQADRVYLIKVKDVGWRVGVLNSTNSAYLPMEQSEEKFPAKKVEERKDITEIWHGIW